MVVQGAADWGGVRVVQLCPEHQLLQSGCCWTWSCSGGCGGPGAFLGVWGGADRPGTARDSPFCGPPGAAVCAQRRTGMGAGPRVRRGPKDGWEAGHWGAARSGDSGSSGNGDRDAAKTRTVTRFKRGPGRGRGWGRGYGWGLGRCHGWDSNVVGNGGWGWERGHNQSQGPGMGSVPQLRSGALWHSWERGAGRGWGRWH